MVDVEIHIVGNEQIQLAVVIVINEGRASRPTGIVHPSGLRYIRKCAVAVILEEAVWPKASYIQIIKPVIIIIAGGDSHSPTDVPDVGLVRYISKRAVTVVVIESAFGLLIGFDQVNGQRVDEVDVRVAIIIIIEEGDSAAHRLDNVPLLRRRDMFESDTSPLCDISKANGIRLITNHLGGN